MLAKVWKKALLAICIIACIYNVMHKLVSRTSLEIQLKSVQNQPGLIDMLKRDIAEDSKKSIKKEDSLDVEKNNVNVENGNTITDDDNTIVVIY